MDNIENTMEKATLTVEIMKKDIQSICEKLNDNTAEHKEIMSKIDAFIKSSDTRYASKVFQSTVERIGWALALIILGALIGAVLKLVLK